MKQPLGGPRIGRLERLGLSRDFSLSRFNSHLASASRNGNRGEILRRLFRDWTGVHLAAAQAEHVWTDIEEMWPRLRKNLGTPLGLPTALLYHLHSRTGLVRQPRLIPARDLAVLRINAITDPLTGLYNRRFLLEHLDREISRAERGEGLVSLVMLDLKGFKSVNDRFGHPVGDSLLVRTARIIRGSLRAIDAGCRWGGDEFVIVLPNTDLLAAFSVAERVRRKLAATSFPRATEVTLGLHYGIAAYPTDGKTADFLLKIADLRLYQCRAQSRFPGPERRRHPRFSPENTNLRLQWSAAHRSFTGAVLDLSHSGLAFRSSRMLRWPPTWKAEIVQSHAPERHPVRLRALHWSPLADGGVRVGCTYA